MSTNIIVDERTEDDSGNSTEEVETIAHDQIEIRISDEVTRLATSMQNNLQDWKFADSNKCCIYKVPEYIQKGYEECYRPLVISIGPVFYKDPTLETLQELKWIYLKSFQEYPGNASQSLEPYINFVRQNETRIRDCYQEQITLSSDEFIQLVVLDAIFLIYVFLLDSDSSNDDAPEPFIENRLEVLLGEIHRDLFIEENQLPYFVLTGIYNLAFGEVHPNVSFTDLALEYIGDIPFEIPGPEAIKSIIDGNKITDSSSISHLVDLLRMCCCLPSFDLQESDEDLLFHEFYSAKHLSAAGIKFELMPNENLFGIKFDKGKLKIPRLPLYDSTEAILRSIMFFEQCHYCDTMNYFVDYILFLDKLIDTVEDVRVLHQNEILDNKLGSDEDAAKLFNEISKNASYSSDFTFSEVSKGLKDYATTPWNQWKAIFWSRYFNHPWAIISVIYAIILLFLTVIQTVIGFTSN